MNELHKSETISFESTPGGSPTDNLVANTVKALRHIIAELEKLGGEVKSMAIVVGARESSLSVFHTGSTAVAAMPVIIGVDELDMAEKLLIEGLLSIASIKNDKGTKSPWVVSSTDPAMQSQLDEIRKVSELRGAIKDIITNIAKKAKEQPRED